MSNDFDDSTKRPDAQPPAGSDSGSNSGSGTGLLDRIEGAFTPQAAPAPAPARDSSVAPPAKFDRAQQVDDLIKSGADAQRDTTALTDSHPGVNMPLDKMSTSQARSINDTQLQAQGVGGASQVSFRTQDGKTETLTKSVENGQTRYYREDGSYLTPAKHTDGSDRYEMVDSKNPDATVRMKELPTVAPSSPADRPPTSAQPPADRPPADRPLGSPTAPVVKGGDSVQVPAQPRPDAPAGSGGEHHGHWQPQTVPVQGGGEAALSPVKGSGNANGSPDSFLYKDKTSGNYYRLDEGPNGQRTAIPVARDVAEQHMEAARS